MPVRRDPGQLEIRRVEHREALLDDALDDSLPASDPPSMVTPHRRPPRAKEKDHA